MNAVTVYYIIGSIAALTGVIAGLSRFYYRQRDRWTLEGRQRAEQAQAVKLNTNKLEENTSAITSLTRELREFIISVRLELSGLSGRLDRLETWRERHDNGEKQ